MQTLERGKRGFAAASNLLAFFVLISVMLNVLSLIFSLGNAWFIFQLSKKPEPSLVQLSDGRSIAVEPAARNFRTPKVVHSFVKDIMTLMFSWNTHSSGGGVDAGVKIDKRRVTAKSWEASFGFSEDFRVNFLKEVGVMTPPDVFSGKAQSVLNITSLTNPTEVSDGKWELSMVANLVIFNQEHPQGLSVPFNKRITVVAVDPIADPLQGDASSIQRAVYQIRQSGLEITEMYELVN